MMRTRSVFKAVQCPDCCRARLGVRSPVRIPHSLYSSLSLGRQFSSSTSNLNTDGGPSTGSAAAPASNSSPSSKPTGSTSGFGSGWGKTTFTSGPKLTPEELKQRERILARTTPPKPQPPRDPAPTSTRQSFQRPDSQGEWKKPTFTPRSSENRGQSFQRSGGEGGWKRPTFTPRTSDGTEQSFQRSGSDGGWRKPTFTPRSSDVTEQSSQHSSTEGRWKRPTYPPRSSNSTAQSVQRPGQQGGWSIPTFTPRSSDGTGQLSQRRSPQSGWAKTGPVNAPIKSDALGFKWKSFKPGQSDGETASGQEKNPFPQTSLSTSQAPWAPSSIAEREAQFRANGQTQLNFTGFRKTSAYTATQTTEDSRIEPQTSRPPPRRDVTGPPSEMPVREQSSTQRWVERSANTQVSAAEGASQVPKKQRKKDKRTVKQKSDEDEGNARPSRFAEDEEYDLDDLDDMDQPRRRRKQGKKEREAAKMRLRKASNNLTPIFLPEFISVTNLANALSVRPAEFLESLRELGFEEATYDHILDAETAGLIAAEYNFEPILETTDDDLVAQPPPEDMSVLPLRPPVVTIMGHVDHGKTTLLDWLRKASVAASEHGGITQHIGAFSVTMPSGKQITFLDTPGHAAFLEMRRRGADVTDIVILVVAADDSVKPQTIEAIKHAKQANVPMIVAINKIDKEDTNVERVKQDLARHNVSVEDFGGDVQAVCVSGKTGQGMLELEEAAVTLSEMLDLRADPEGNVEGWVIESTTRPGGKVATILVKRGTLRPGDIIVAGTAWARVRKLKNEAGVDIGEALPGTPVEIDGWRGQPLAGLEVLQAPNEQRAKAVVSLRIEKEEIKQLSGDMDAINEARREKRQQDRLKQDGESSEDLTDASTSGPKPIPFIVKADVSGSIEAIINSISGIGNNEVYASVLRSGVGPISEFDIDHAEAANAYIVSFNQDIDPERSRLAQSKKVKLLDHRIIYELMDDVKAQVSEHLPPNVVQRVSGEAQIGQIFEITIKGRKKTLIAGCKVKNGVINRGHKVRVLRGPKKDIIYDGALTSLKHVKKDVTEMRKGTECGMAFENWTDFMIDDEVQTYEEIHEKRSL